MVKNVCQGTHCSMGHMGMKSGFHNVGFFHISVSSISLLPLTPGSHFYTYRNESVMRSAGRDYQALPRRSVQGPELHLSTVLVCFNAHFIA